MLYNQELFDRVERALSKKGVIEDFEKENGKIKGHMMITLADPPKDVKIKTNKSTHYFEATFDFYNCSLGIMFDVKRKQAKSGIFMTPQKDNAEGPAEEWIEFFIRILINGIEPDGSFGYPMYTFISDEADFTVVPTENRALLKL